MSWTVIVVASLGCFAAKLIGTSIPPRWLAHERVLAATDLLPVALLASLVVTQTFFDGHDVVVDERAAALGVAAVAVWRRAPFLVVIVLAATTAAVLRI